MPVVFMDGFDNYSTDGGAAEYLQHGWTLATGMASTSSTVTRYGTGRAAYGATSSTAGLAKKDLVKTDYLTLGYAWMGDGESDPIESTTFIRFYEDAGLQVNIKTDSGWHIAIYDDNGAHQGTSANTFSIGVWYYIEVSIYSHATAGTVTINVDGEEWVSATGIDTGNGLMNGFHIYPPDNLHIDDLYVSDDAVMLGAPRIHTLFTNAQGTGTSNWNGDYTDVDDDDPVTAATRDSTYIDSSTTDQTEILAFDNLPAGNWDIKAVSPSIRAYNSDSGTPTYAVTCDQGATETTIATGATYLHTEKVHMHADGSSGGWDDANDVDTLEITIKYE